jgi:hypothetical protein
MPRILRWLMWMCFGFGLFLPLSLIPVGGHYINGQQVTFEEFWRRGGGPIFFVAGILFPIAGYGFVRARNWSRYLYVGMHIPLVIWSLIGFSLDSLLTIAWTAFAIYYLFFRANVREYFGGVGDAGI